MKKHTYVLGTAVSHDGSSCLLKDGKICVSIEKERLTKIKHDGGNDTKTIEYCLNAEGITLQDLDLIVQNANYGMFEYGSGYYHGQRLFSEEMGIPIVTISHHLAHAYSTIGTCPFKEFNILVMDGHGNAFDECMDLDGAFIPDIDSFRALPHLFSEKDSYYKFDGETYTSLIKDFTEFGAIGREYPFQSVPKHSIGGLYGAVSGYCFKGLEDSGKLMGLAPYGRPGMFNEQIFECKDGRVFANYDWMHKFRKPARSPEVLKKDFQYYADLAYGTQQEVERAIIYIVKSRIAEGFTGNLCYSGGTALNAVANAKIMELCNLRNFYIEPAAGDNGLALGCAFYGWLEVLRRERVMHNGSTCFGKTYSSAHIREEIDSFSVSTDLVKMRSTIDLFFEILHNRRHRIQGGEPVIQFSIDDIGVYQIVFKGELKCVNGVSTNPNCIVHVEANDFYQAITRPISFITLIKAGKVRVSNPAEFNTILTQIDLEDVIGLLKQQLNGAMKDKSGRVKYIQCDDYIKQAAKLLSEGYILGWFQDGCEFGPRALGRRSVLADPGKPGVRDFINTHIKFREDFRPFAPSVLLEDAPVYFKKAWESPYMILVDEVREQYKEQLSGVVHVNNTCRVQTVTETWNPKYYSLLKEYKAITGSSVLLNTSFNRKGAPIVETPRDALDFFFSCKLDYMVIDQYVISK